MADMGAGLKLKKIYGTPENLANKIAEYFLLCKKHKKPATIERLAEHLDCSDRTLTRYNNYFEKYECIEDNEGESPDDFIHNEEKVDFCRPIKKAYQRIKAEDIERLKERGNAGDIFIAKNHGYKDTQQVESTNKNENINLNIDDLDTIKKRLKEKLGE